MNWRRSEWLSLATILVVVGWIWSASSKNTILEQTVQEVGEIKPQVYANSKDIQSIKEVQTVQMSLVLRELDSIHKDIRDIKRQGGGG